MFTAVAVVTIALGIGVNAGIFTVLNGVLFRDLPAPDAHELVSISQTVDGRGGRRHGQGTFSTSEYRAYRDRAQTLSGVLALRPWAETTLGGEAPQQIIRHARQLQLLRGAAAASRARASAGCAGLRARRGSCRRARSRPLEDDVRGGPAGSWAARSS